MAVCGHSRKDRVHQCGGSNRPKGWSSTDGPIDIDTTMRETKPNPMTFKVDVQVPANHRGEGNLDFSPKLPGHDFRQPKADRSADRKILKETRAREELEKTRLQEKVVPTIVVKSKLQAREDRTRRDKAFKQAPRWNPRNWHDDPSYTRGPLAKEEGETWNSRESQKIQSDIKGSDRLMRSVRRPEDVATPVSDAGGGRHPLSFDKEEYYPGRDLIDALGDEPDNDYQIRPTHLPDFGVVPPPGADPVARMQRIRCVIRQRYAGRPGLVKTFRNCARTKPGYIFPQDIKEVMDQMGIKISDEECNLLVSAVDKDQKGAVTFEEFSDLVYGTRVNVGGPEHEPQERHVRHVTKQLVDDLLRNGQMLGKAFCEIDPERHYTISKEQFTTALGTACNHISKQAIDFLWAAQFPGANDTPATLQAKRIDWRGFMAQLAHFAHDFRLPTPCCVQSRKRQYDLLQRTAALTGGVLHDDADLNRPDQNTEDEVRLVAGKLLYRQKNLQHLPRDAAFLSEPFVEDIRIKADRAGRTLPKRIGKARMRQLLANRDVVHQDELVEMLCRELDNPGYQEPLVAQQPAYASSSSKGVDVLTLDPQSSAAQELAQAVGGASPSPALGDPPPGVSLQLRRADVEAYVSIQRTNRDHEVDVKQLMENVYRPPDEVKAVDTVNDGLNRALRGNRPPRERPPANEERPYQNYWHARYMFELINDAVAAMETSNGGKLKPSKLFKRLDMDNDGYITMADLRKACVKYKVQTSEADIQAAFSELDRDDNGSVEIGEFTRNYEVNTGNLVEEMQKPIKAVYYEGGTERGGPVQEELDRRQREIMAREQPEAAGSPSGASGRGRSAPPTGGSGRVGSDRAGSTRSQLSNTGQSMVYESQVARLTGKARISDVIRSRCSAWKPQKHELYTTLPPTRYGMTYFPDTRHVTEANMPLSSSYLSDTDRFKTTSNAASIYTPVDYRTPQVEDSMRKKAQTEFRTQRIQQHRADFAERCAVANEASRQFDEMKVARKAMNQLNYERRCQMAAS